MGDETANQEFVLAPRRVLAGLYTMGVALCVGFVPMLMLIDGPTGGLPGLAFLPLVLIPSVALIFFIAGLRQVFHSVTARIEHGSVIFTRTGLTGTRVTTVPRAEFLGIGTHTRRRRQGKSRRTDYIVTLTPREGSSAARVDLASTRNEGAVRGMQEAWARRLGVPMISIEDGGTVHLRAPGEVDLGIRDRITGGSITIEPGADLALPPQSGLLTIAREPLKVTIDRLTPEYSPAHVALSVLIPLALVIVGVAQDIWFLAIVAFAVMVLFAWVAWRDRTTRLRLVIEPAMIRIERVAATGEAHTESSIAVARIEEVLIQGQALHFVADTAKANFGSFLPQPTLVWLKQSVLAAIAQMK